jgi:hypothetical protein
MSAMRRLFSLSVILRCEPSGAIAPLASLEG